MRNRNTIEYMDIVVKKAGAAGMDVKGDGNSRRSSERRAQRRADP